MPLRRWIANDLRRRIEAGEFPPGSQLPTMLELMAEYGTSHEPVRSALLVLESEGLTEGRQGKRVYVREQA